MDVTDDYRFMQPPMPSDFYPIIQEIWVPKHKLETALTDESLIAGYLYDWHESPKDENGFYYVGVVEETFLAQMPKYTVSASELVSELGFA
ncbi:MAG: hypothetical protein JSS72_06595 [Armatimonadetes bacterium]|nr:hypothetical protein [Armatimonadota bacterium]